MNLGRWYDKTKKTFGKKSAATVYLAKLIEQSDKGRDEEMTVDDFQITITLLSVHQKGLESKNYDFIDEMMEEGRL